MKSKRRPRHERTVREAGEGTHEKGNETMNKIEKLREEARAVVASYGNDTSEEDFELIAMKLASIGWRLEDALATA